MASKFKEQSTRFLDDVTKQVEEAQSQSLRQKIVSEAEMLYAEAQQETEHMLREIMEIVEMVNQLTTCIYDCGSTMNRIDAYLTNAETAIDKGVANLEDIAGVNAKVEEVKEEGGAVDAVLNIAKKTKAGCLMNAVNQMRKVTYIVLLVDIVLCLVKMVIAYRLNVKPNYINQFVKK